MGIFWCDSLNSGREFTLSFNFFLLFYSLSLSLAFPPLSFSIALVSIFGLLLLFCILCKRCFHHLQIKIFSAFFSSIFKSASDICVFYYSHHGSLPLSQYNSFINIIFNSLLLRFMSCNTTKIQRK